MLQSLSIKNFALIKSENIEFGKGLNIFLGETGAGKSLIFDAIFFALGLKSDKSFIRNGEEQLKIDVLFTDLSLSVKNELKSLDFEDVDELLITRIMNLDGRSSVRINGEIATLSTLKNLSKLLVDTLVQHESIELLKTKNHLSMLDSFVGKECVELKQELSQVLAKISQIEKKIDSLGGDSEERERKKEILEFQIDEIDSAELKIGEDEEIEERLTLLSSAEKIKEHLGQVLNLLSTSDRGAVGAISDSVRYLNSLSNIEKISSLQERLNNSKYELEDIYAELENIFEDSNFDEIEYNRLDQRKDLIKKLKKKYGTSIDDIFTFSKRAKEQYDEISSSEITIEKLTKEKIELNNILHDIAIKLSSIRKNKAEEIKEKVISELKDLGMKGTRFEIKFEEKGVIGVDGLDNVTFEFSANEGQEIKNISKTASGGETSRIMLALKNVFTSSELNKTLLFDEVDSGISGETGNMIAIKLHNIAKADQIICITHLPQVACSGDNFIKVSKTVQDGQTISNARQLTEDEVAENIARLISGKALTETALQHAKELREKFKSIV